MKIDNFAMDMHTQSIETSTVNTTFTDELQVENAKRAKELSSIEEEFEFLKQLQLDMVNKLIEILSKNSPSIANNCRCKDFDVKENMMDFESDSFIYRRLSIDKKTTVSQDLDVSMNGFVQSGDKKIELNMNISFSSTYVETHSLSKTAFYDPLVININGKIPELDSVTFDFDIDMDGQKDQISMLKDGNGFLALDRDDNGIIDDGKELFGTQNGNGFLDLKRYDSDQNNWIDENDLIFDKLRIWNKSQTGDSILALGEVGIGAIYLGYAEGQFDLRNEASVLGRVQSNGLYLNEDGSSGLISQIDFAKHNKMSANEPTPFSELLQA